jgi:hypothetical protein
MPPVAGTFFQADDVVTVRLSAPTGAAVTNRNLRLAVVCFTPCADVTQIEFHGSGSNISADDETERFVRIRLPDEASEDAAAIRLSNAPDDVVVIACLAFSARDSVFSAILPEDKAAGWSLRVASGASGSSTTHRLGSAPALSHSAGAGNHAAPPLTQLSPRSQPTALFGVYFDRRCTKHGQWELVAESSAICGQSWEPIINGVRNVVGLGRLGRIRVPPGSLEFVARAHEPQHPDYPMEPVGLAAKLRVAIGWDDMGGGSQWKSASTAAAGSADLDVACLAVDANCESIIATCFWAQLEVLGGSLEHSGDNLTGAGDGDDESITVSTMLVPPSVHSLVFVITSQNGTFGSCAKNIHFSASQQLPKTSSLASPQSPSEMSLLAFSSALEEPFSNTRAFVPCILMRSAPGSPIADGGRARTSGFWSLHVVMHDLQCIADMTAITDQRVRNKVLAFLKSSSPSSSPTGRIKFAVPAGSVRPRVVKQKPASWGSCPQQSPGGPSSAAPPSLARSATARTGFLDWRFLTVFAAFVALYGIMKL